MIPALREEILLYIRTHKGATKSDVLIDVCPTMQVTGYDTIMDLVQEGLVKQDNGSPFHTTLWLTESGYDLSEKVLHLRGKISDDAGKVV